MIISLIVAMDKNHVIGKDNKMPWHIPDDLKRFKTLTMGKPIIMGRKTYGSIGNPLPGRKNVILTRDKNFNQEGCYVANSIDEALKQCNGYEEAMVIGGANIYKQFLPITKRIYLTLVDGKYEGDTFFPELNMSEWEETIIDEPKANDPKIPKHIFKILERKSKK